MSDLPQFHYAGFWRRFAAQFIDGLLFLIPNFLLFSTFKHEQFIGNIVYLSIIAIYYVGFISSPWQATIGKRLMKVYVITKSGGSPSLTRILARFFLFLFPGLPTFVPGFYFLYLTKQERAEIINAQHFKFIHELAFTTYAILLEMLIGVAVLFLIWYVPVFFTKEKKSIVDMICGTRVVKGKAASVPNR